MSLRIRRLALESMIRLLKLAYEMETKGKSDLARRYVDLVFRISRRTKVKIPRYWRRFLCKKCKSILIPGRTCRVRIRAQSSRASHITITCLRCGWMKRYYIKGGTLENKPKKT